MPTSATTAPLATQLTFELPDDACQRWKYRAHSFRRTSEGGFDPARYRVHALPAAPARAFVTTHHYSSSWPAVRMPFGLIDRATPGQFGGGALVGVLALGVPMHPGVLTGVFPWLAPYAQTLELSRLVLLDEVPANAETWFTKRALRLAAEQGIRGIVAHSDPQPRVRQTPDGPRQLHVGHVGCVYQAGGMAYLGRTRARRLTVLPDGSLLPDRAISKIRAGESGHGGAEARLVAFGARPRAAREPGKEWLEEALATIGATVLDHRGNHRYGLQIGPRNERRPLTVTAYPYPRKHQAAS
ncbi:hypothetical protein ACFV3E_40910 [Streptomyces sp. NPDC059718]